MQRLAHQDVAKDLVRGLLLGAVLYVRNFFGPMHDMAMFYNAYQGAAAALADLRQRLTGLLATVAVLGIAGTAGAQAGGPKMLRVFRIAMNTEDSP